MKALPVGKMRHRITIQTRVRSRTPQGGFTYTWSDLRTIWSMVEPKTGRETLFGDAIRGEATHFITIRAQTETITPDMRISWGTRVFNILSALRIDEIQHEVQIAAVENLSVSEDATGTTDLITTFQTDLINFLNTQSITKSMPSGKRFYPDSVEIICSVAGGTVNTQPTIAVGISGNTTKYLNRTPTLITAANKRQLYTGLDAGDGETAIIFSITSAGAISAGSFKGYLLAKGVLV